jgi:hypothetical protein
MIGFDFRKTSDWGEVTMGGRKYAARRFVGWCGVAFWLFMMFISTGANGLWAIRDVDVYMLFLLVATQHAPDGLEA